MTKASNYLTLPLHVSKFSVSTYYTYEPFSSYQLILHKCSRNLDACLNGVRISDPVHLSQQSISQWKDTLFRSSGICINHQEMNYPRTFTPITVPTHNTNLNLMFWWQQVLYTIVLLAICMSYKNVYCEIILYAWGCKIFEAIYIYFSILS